MDDAVDSSQRQTHSQAQDPLPPGRPSVTVAVLLQREAQPNQWEDWRFSVVDVVAHQTAFGDQPRVLRDDGKLQTRLHPNFELTLYPDEAEGYFLNLSSGAPVWFVVWRVSDEDPSVAWAERVSLSYTEAGRWLDAQERVDNVPLPADLAAWLQSYVEVYYRPEVKKERRRPQSFVSPGERR
ncbi:DUF3305 domain-containing protein [Paucibacter sp. Y2R2-4]|uniref:DUF3305 domain-containing protein n=1 Tax=Paucibacter sp. Y2R2-4 TaxID=2893553 RepID=UPI0021E4C6E6|nr:DUF3305 domain-containing protein [Paucibacter sp. Y2R2-4]MCV2349009.1 DUF3305 domain-containing protein [Paucibacter sp. Y2R2-4]